jgi:hypothetical protein
LNVIDFGARGDAGQFLASTISNSDLVTVLSTNRFSSADVGKVVELFGVGPYTTATNNQDLLAIIKEVFRGTNLTLSTAPSATSPSVLCTCGTQNAPAFQKCVDACTGTNTIVIIPAGNYLLIPPSALLDFAMTNEFETRPTVVVQKGGIHFLGAGSEKTILTGNGAWTMKGKHAYRGYMFACQGPVANDAPLIFDNLTMDGGVAEGRTAYSYFPASTNNGWGWDVTHDAVIDAGDPPYHRFKSFRNCNISHWRGEMFKSVVDHWDGFIEITNCVFSNGNATGFNFTFTHDINHCVFTDLIQATEFYQGYCSNTCFFQNNVVTNMSQAILAINGALSNRVPPNYVIRNNTFYLQGGENGIQTTPAQNLSIIGNTFIGPGLAITLGSAGYQGSSVNSNIIIAGNAFSNVNDALMIEGEGKNAVWNVIVTNNSATGLNGNGFASGYGWGTNLVVKENFTTGLSYGLNSTQLSGGYYPDDPSNRFPPYFNFDYDGRTNLITYAHGMRHQIGVSRPASTWILDDAHPSQMPLVAFIVVTNIQPLTVSLFLSKVRHPAGASVMLTNGGAVMCKWKDGGWQLNSTEP